MVRALLIQRDSLRPVRYRPRMRKVGPVTLPLAPRRTMVPAPGAVLRPVIGVDIDGTLAQWHEHFLWFASLYLGVELPGVWEGNEPFWKMSCGNKTRYREVKLAYRQSGLKRAMPALFGAAEMVRSLRNRGCEIWICTTRPYLRLDNIDPDTRAWLRRNSILFDGVLYGERKWADLAKLVGPQRVIGVVDDLPEQVEAAKKAGLTSWLMRRPYTVGRYDNLLTISEARHVLLGRCDEWLKENHVK